MELLTALTVVGLLVLGRPVRLRRSPSHAVVRRHEPVRARLRCAHRW